MKKLLSLMFLAGIIFLVFNFQKNTKDEPILGDSYPEVKEDNVPLSASVSEIAQNSKVYTAYYLVVEPEEVELLPNFSDKNPANKLLTDTSCRGLINGGFYDSVESKNSPIGLFVSGGNTLSEYKPNRLFDGILSVNQFAVAKVSRTTEEGLRQAVQTGPILKENNSYINLSLVRDEPARRMVGGVTGDNKLVFIAIVDKNSSFSGPFLEELPEILKTLEEVSGMKIADAVNLDGGAASAFIADGVILSEVSPIGSYWCIK